MIDQLYMLYICPNPFKSKTKSVTRKKSYNH